MSASLLVNGESQVENGCAIVVIVVVVVVGANIDCFRVMLLSVGMRVVVRAVAWHSAVVRTLLLLLLLLACANLCLTIVFYEGVRLRSQ